jgi:hypothetical protein
MSSYARVLAVATLLFAIPPLAGATERPMTDEEVVRMFVAGHSVESILLEIERREPGFDLDPEMLRELRRVALPEAIIEAMQRRQALERPPEEPSPPSPAPPVEPGPVLRVLLSSGERDGPRTISVRARVPPELAAEWDPHGSTVDLMLTDLALFLICETPEHVPDHWRLASPMGRDFFSVRRHRMLQFVTGTDDGTEGGRVKLELPPVLEAPVEWDEPHDLAVGLAVRVNGQYIAVVQDRRPGTVISEAGDLPEARVSGRSLKKLAVRFVRDGDDEAADDAGPAPGQDDSLKPAGETRFSKRPVPPS